MQKHSSLAGTTQRCTRLQWCPTRPRSSASRRTWPSPRRFLFIQLCASLPLSCAPSLKCLGLSCSAACAALLQHTRLASRVFSSPLLFSLLFLDSSTFSCFVVLSASLPHRRHYLSAVGLCSELVSHSLVTSFRLSFPFSVVFHVYLCLQWLLTSWISVECFSLMLSWSHMRD